jgi:hypothetical protein
VTVPCRRPGFSELFDRAAAACAESQRLVSLSAHTLTATRSWGGAAAPRHAASPERRADAGHLGRG